ncbi:hypothetical protein EV401DRAFT_1939661 [Pisolithus croceorrhizus]|nr:hypothetical protein EV401DRAFT_1939661 [Pisolithus croceorrhizus]
MLWLLRLWLYACMRVPALRHGHMICTECPLFPYLRSYSFARDFEGGSCFPSIIPERIVSMGLLRLAGSAPERGSRNGTERSERTNT